MEFKNLNFATGEPDKVQVRDLMRVVGIFAHFPHGKIRFYRAPGGKWTRDLCRLPQAAVLHGRARQSSRTGRCGDCISILWVPGPRLQYSGKIRFIDKPGVQDERSKRTSDTRVAYPEVKCQVRDLVRVVDIVAHFDHRVLVPGKNSFYRVLGDKWAEKTSDVCPQQRYATGEPGKVQGRESRDYRRVL